MGKSHQKGWIVARGKKWYGYFRRKTSNPITKQISFEIVPVVLGSKSEFSKFEAREALEREIARLTGQLPVDRTVCSKSVTLGWFVRHRYFLLKQADWSEETAKVKRFLIEKDLLDDFETSHSKTSTNSLYRSTSTNWLRRDRETGCCRFGLICGTSSSKQSIRTTS